MAAFKEKRFLKYLVEESDTRAKELGITDKTICTYSNQASQIAQVVLRYLEILPRWNNLVEINSDKYKPHLERFWVRIYL